MGFVARRGAGLLFLCLLGAMPTACSSDDSDKPQEPVAPQSDKGLNPDDPDAPKGDNAAAKNGDNGEPVAPLTDNPFNKDQAGAQGDAPGADAAPPPVADGGDAMQGALTNEPPAVQPAPSETPSAAEPTKGKGKKKGKAAVAVAGDSDAAAPAGGGAEKYVKGYVLNVRSKPTLKAPIVKHLLGGAKVNAEVHGKWAKIGENMWVKARYLSDKPTRKVTKAQASGNVGKAAAGKKKGKGAKKAAAPAAPEAPAQGAESAAPAEAAPAPDAPGQ